MVNPVFLVSIKFLYFALTCLAIERLTVCVTGAGAGVDSAWEQRKPEARKMLQNAAESPPEDFEGTIRDFRVVDPDGNKLGICTRLNS